MYIYFFVEEFSMERALKNLLPGMVSPEYVVQIITFQCKNDLLKKLESRLMAYSSWVSDDYYFVVLVDKDDDNCFELKQKLETISQRAGFVSKSAARENNKFQILNRIVIEEIEAWYFGDPDAMRTAFPRLSKTFERKEKYRNPDTIVRAWETMELFLQRSRYFSEGLSKSILAESVSKHMNPARNRSKSFQVFRDGLQELISQ